MKKIIYFLFVSALMFTAGCADSFYDVYNEFTGPVTGVSVKKTTSIVVDTTEQLYATVYPSRTENKNVTWSSSNTGIVDFDANGKITGVTVGTATITVTTAEGGYTAECIVTVEPTPIPILSLNFSSTTTIPILGTVDLNPPFLEIVPGNATNTQMKWKSDNIIVASVDSDTGIVTGHSTGSANITATSVTWGKTATCQITVVGAANITSVTVSGFVAPIAGATSQLVGSLTAGNATYTVTSLTWSPVTTTYEALTVYTATVFLTSTAGYKFPVGGIATPIATEGGGTVSAGTTAGADVSGNALYFTVAFPATPTTINISVIAGVNAPTVGATPVTTITATEQYTGTVTWSDTPATFEAVTTYTATITLTPKAGYTLTGVAANFFTVAGVTSVTNPVDSGVITAVFPVTTPAIGGNYQGGIVAYILQSGDPGYDPAVQHGLIAATADLGLTVSWITGGNTTNTENGGTSSLFGTGLANTNAIVAQAIAAGTTDLQLYAAGRCDAYTNAETGTGVYSDWYLPSSNELAKIYANRLAIGNFATDKNYWSSSEETQNTSLFMNYTTIVISSATKNSLSRVRAVRFF